MNSSPGASMSGHGRNLARFTAILLTALTVSAADAQTPASTTMQPAPAPVVTPVPPEIEVGWLAPDFTLDWADSAGARAEAVKLSDLRGKVVVLAFYPVDRSSGCTAELIKFRDEFATIFGPETVLIPISNDSIATHASWAAEMKFPFALASDPTLSVARQYGSFTPGKTYANRTVFVIGKDGRILWRNLKFVALSENAYTDLAAEVAKAR